MRVVITGGTGLIGQRLVKSLAEDGHQVVILSRNPHQDGPLPATVSFAKWDAKTAEGWAQQVDDADAIVNLAGESIAGDGFLPARWTPDRKRAIVNSRVNAGKALIEAMRKAVNKPAVLIQSSAVGYYGPRKAEEITEDTPAGKDFLADVCKQWEASTAEAEAMGIRRAIIRTGVVLSTQGGALPRQSFPFRLFAGGPLGSGKQYYPWIHIDDEIAAIRYLIDNPAASGAYNLTAPNPVTNAQFSRALGRVMKRPSIVPVPGFSFKLLFGEVSTVLLDGQRAIPARLKEMGYDFRFPQPEGALHDLFHNKK
jgi:hypothetical protein